MLGSFWFHLGYTWSISYGEMARFLLLLFSSAAFYSTCYFSEEDMMIKPNAGHVLLVADWPSTRTKPNT